MSHLVLKDNIRASAACKSWREASVSVRVVEKHPWLMCFPKRGNSFKLCDPLEWNLYTLERSELAKSTVCYSRDGWLLMHRSSSNDIFFINPFSQELISLPKFELSFMEIAFSCPPTTDDCVVVALKFVVDNLVTVSTCNPGATEWITEDFPTFREVHMQSRLVNVNDRFYCFNAGQGCLYSFHPSSRTWNFHYAYRLECPYKYNNQQYGLDEKSVFLAEKKGEFFLMFTSGNQKPLVYKLVSLKWEKMSGTKLDGLTFFVSFYNSELRTDLPWMRNNVYFSRFGYIRKYCLSYSFDERRYMPRKLWQTWLQHCPLNTLWIDPPKNVLDSL